ncbi:hypothetical protein VTO42DRAFT_3040 [Malbranchea cinnamomea]
MAAKARHVASGIRALSNTVRGAPVQLLSLINQLDLVLWDALRGALPVYKTTPIPALQREIRILPMKLVLNHRHAVFAIRIKRLDSWHPLVRRCSRAAYNPPYTTRLSRAAAQAGTAESYNPLASPPWVRIARKDDSQIGFPATCSKEQAAKDFKTWLQKRNPLDLVVFTDGSQLVHPQCMAGNEKADQEAKAAAALVAAAAPHDGPATLAYMHWQIKEQAMQAFKEYWAQNAPRRYMLPTQDMEILQNITPAGSMKMRNATADVVVVRARSTSITAA